MKSETLESVYLEVESIVLKDRGFLYSDQILSAFISANGKSTNECERHLIELEIRCWSGKWTNEGWVKRRDVGAFQLTEKDLSYFESRVSQCQSHLLRAKYAHFRWQFKKSSYGLAALAIEEYLKYATILMERVSNDEEGYPASDLIDILCQTLCLAIIGAKAQIEKVKLRIIDCCTSQQGKSTLLMSVKLSEFILKQRKFFKNDLYPVILKRLWELIQKQEIGQYEVLTRTAFDLGIQFSEKCSKDTQPDVNWKLELGEYLLRVAQSREFHTGSTVFLHEAIKAFQQAKALERAADTKLIFEKARKRIKLSVHTVELSEEQQAIF